MLTKILGCAALALGVTVAGVSIARGPAKPDCCYPGSPCCYPGSPCCTEGCFAATTAPEEAAKPSCCSPGSPCCEAGAPCCAGK